MRQIPNKLYFRIGEVSDLVEVKPYVLRYWESEFPDIKPTKSKSGQRLYKRRDVELLLRIKELLYGERFTINGARKRLKEFTRADVAQHNPGSRDEEAIPSDESAEKLVPQQLEVFAAEEPVDEGPSDDLGHAVARESRPLNRSGIKAFQKIKRDLEELLTIIRA